MARPRARRRDRTRTRPAPAPAPVAAAEPDPAPASPIDPLVARLFERNHIDTYKVSWSETGEEEGQEDGASGTMACWTAKVTPLEPDISAAEIRCTITQGAKDSKEAQIPTTFRIAVDSKGFWFARATEPSSRARKRRSCAARRRSSSYRIIGEQTYTHHFPDDSGSSTFVKRDEHGNTCVTLEHEATIDGFDEDWCFAAGRGIRDNPTQTCGETTFGALDTSHVVGSDCSAKSAKAWGCEVDLDSMAVFYEVSRSGKAWSFKKPECHDKEGGSGDEDE